MLLDCRFSNRGNKDPSIFVTVSDRLTETENVMSLYTTLEGAHSIVEEALILQERRVLLYQQLPRSDERPDCGRQRRDEPNEFSSDVTSPFLQTPVRHHKPPQHSPPALGDTGQRPSGLAHHPHLVVSAAFVRIANHLARMLPRSSLRWSRNQ
ncbi:hypothetical protein CDAR_262931 [Caerostris darwini]|uniref:Uncharacterized protein n=1 Tax=Caerostris darwini TaxID=1538125 RepID=A0AAV4RTB8_9ARAC|nr:hypothetical protein CDAR_262931 [Caerostris darwini]